MAATIVHSTSTGSLPPANAQFATSDWAEGYGSMFDTPFYKSAVSGDCEILKRLIEEGHDVNRIIRGHSALELVINNELRYGTRPLEILLDAGADPNRWVRWKDYFGNVEDCICENPSELPSTILHACDSNGRSALYISLGNEENHGTLDNIIREISILNFVASSRGLPAPAAAWNQMPNIFFTLLNRGLCPFMKVQEESVFEKACKDGQVSYVYEILRNYPQLLIR